MHGEGFFYDQKPLGSAVLGIVLKSPQRPRCFGGARTCKGKPDPTLEGEHPNLFYFIFYNALTSCIFARY